MRPSVALVVLALVVAARCSDSSEPEVLSPAAPALPGLRGGDGAGGGGGVDDIEALTRAAVSPTTTCNPRNALCVTVREKPLSEEAARAALESPDRVRCIKNMRRDGDFMGCDQPVEREGGFEILRGDNDAEVHNYDSVFSSSATNAEVYTGLVSDLVEKAFRGHNAALFAYGSTGSGKTFSMGFDPTAVAAGKEGALQYFLDDVLARNRQRVEDGKQKYKIEFSAYQIYSQLTKFGGYSRCRSAIYDLCKKSATKSADPLNLVKVFPEGRRAGVIHDLIKRPFEAKENVLQCLENRATADNGYNDVSSRSFAIIQVRLIMAAGRVANMYFIDLAGSEDVNSYLESVANKEERKKEGLSINTGLLNLGRCMRGIGTGDGCARTEHPLIFALYDDLFNRKMKGMVWLRVLSTVRMEPRFLSDTASTLKFTSDLKKIKVTPVDVEYVDDDDEAVDYLNMIKNLKAQVEHFKGMNEDAQSELRKLRAENEQLMSDDNLGASNSVVLRSKDSDPDVCFTFLHSDALRDMTQTVFNYVNSFEKKYSLLIAPPRPDVDSSFWETLFGESGKNKEKKARYSSLLKTRSEEAEKEIMDLNNLKDQLREDMFERLHELVSYDPTKHRNDYCMRTLSETFPRVVASIADIWTSLQSIADHPDSNSGLLIPLVGGLVSLKRTVCELWRSLRLSLKISAQDGQIYEFSDLCSNDLVQIVGSESGTREVRAALHQRGMFDRNKVTGVPTTTDGMTKAPEGSERV